MAALVIIDPLVEPLSSLFVSLLLFSLSGSRPGSQEPALWLAALPLLLV
jgi:hypothetical protein